MSSYADRLNQFNQATSAATDHISKIKDTLTNPALQENPVMMGLNLAGQTIGTAEGLVRIRAGMKNDDVQRNVQKAFYSKLGDLSAAKKNMSDTVGATVNQARAAAGQTAGSFVADTGSTLNRSVANVQSGATTLADKINPSASDLADVDGGISDGVSQFPRSVVQSSGEANELNKNINQKINAGLSGDERSALNDKLGSSIGSIDDINALGEGGAKTQAMSEFLTAKNNVANDVLSRKSQGLPDADGYTATGQPLQSSAAPSGTSNTNLSIGGAAAQDASNGAANVGNNSSATVARNVSTDNGASLIPPNVSAAIDGDDSTVVQRGTALGLSRAPVPAQGGGSVPGLSTVDAPSTNALSVSRAQQFAAETHSRAQSAASGIETGLEDEGEDFASGLSGGARGLMSRAGGMLGDFGALAGAGMGMGGLTASGGARNSDGLQRVQQVAGAAQQSEQTLGLAKPAVSGIQKALGVEEGLDVLAPDTGPLAPILEAGSMLATLGTGIASIFESDKPATPPPPPPKQKIGISIGADLQTSASGNVGAF